MLPTGHSNAPSPLTSADPGASAVKHAPPRVVIAVRHALFRTAVRRLIEDAGLLVAGEAGDADQAVACSRDLQPDVLVLDTVLPGREIRLLLAELHAVGPHTRILVLGDLGDKGQIAGALRLGVRGVVHKDVNPDLLVRAIRSVAMEEFWVTRETVAQILGGLRNRAGADGVPLMSRLTPRECDVVAAVAGGAGNEEIAKKLGLRLQTVKNHLSTIFDKLGVSTRLELAVYAAHHGLGDRAE